MTINPIKWYKQITALLKIKGMVSNMKINELRTSSGRMTLILNIVGIYSAIQGFIPAPLMAKLAVASVAVYTIGRAIVNASEVVAKFTKTTKDDVIVEEAKKILDAVTPK